VSNDLIIRTPADLVVHTTSADRTDGEFEPTPTDQIYSRELSNAFLYFNRALFDAKLPQCLITLPRRKRTYGYFSPRRFENGIGQVIDEIALNPDHLKRGDRETLSTLVHEMVHAWQHHYGRPSRTSYHNRQWADKMESVGLMPSDTGVPGGKRTGQNVSHYIVDGALFDRACKILLDGGFAISWKSATAPEGEKCPPCKAGRREKYTCLNCGWQLWGKSGGLFICINCRPAGVEVPPEITALCMEQLP
jgi:hypothetical protein